MTGKSVNIFHQRKNKSNMSLILIISNDFFLVIVLLIFRNFNRKRRDHLKLCYLAISLIVILPKDGFPFNFTSLQKCSTNEFFNLETIISSHYIQHITLHQNLVCLVIINLKYKDYNNFYQFILLLSGDVSLNPGC